MIVVDANIIVYLLIENDSYTDPAENLFQKDSTWIAPPIWKSEFLNVLTGYFRREIIDSDNCRDIYVQADKHIETREMPDFRSVFRIIETSRLTAYDSQYVALATDLNLPLITEDKKIIQEFPTVAKSIEGFLSL